MICGGGQQAQHHVSLLSHLCILLGHVGAVNQSTTLGFNKIDLETKTSRNSHYEKARGFVPIEFEAEVGTGEVAVDFASSPRNKVTSVLVAGTMNLKIMLVASKISSDLGRIENWRQVTSKEIIILSLGPTRIVHGVMPHNNVDVMRRRCLEGRREP